MNDKKKYESMSVQEKWNTLATVANLYYNSDLTQNQIAERMYTSRSKVSRMLKEARDLGVVEIYIHEPWERNLDFEQRLKGKYGLKSIRVIAIRDTDNELQKIAEAAAYYLDSIVKQDMVVGISWGNTLYCIVKYARANNRKNIPITVVPIMGAANIKSPEKDAVDLSKELASTYGGRYRYIYAPLFVNNKSLKENLIQEENIKNVLEVSAGADIILTSVGSIIHKSWSDYLSNKVLEALEHKGAIGHIGGHFYNIDGKEIETALSERMIGLSLEEIKHCPDVICVACGERKAEPVLGALRGGFLNTLIIDENCARRILEIQQ